MRKLDIIKNRKTSDVGKVTFEVDNTKQIEAMSFVKESIDKLHALIDGKEDFDFEKIVSKLDELSNKLNLGEQFVALKKSIDGFEIPAMPGEFNIKNLDEALSKIQKLNTNLANIATISGVGSSNDTLTTTIIPAQGKGRLVITDIIIANSSDTDVDVNIQDGGVTKLTYPAPNKGGAIHAMQKPLILSPNTALTFSSTMDANTIKVSAIGFIARP